MKYIYHLIAVFFPAVSFSQLMLGGNNPQDLVTHALAGSGVSISNITYTGSSEAISYFTANTQNMPFHSGLLITTGYRNFALGPNNDSKAGVDNGYPGSTIIESYLMGGSHNAAILSFDLIPAGDSLKIKYIFGSEEYPEYSVSSQYSDAFAILVQGPGIPGTVNIARLPNNATISTQNVGPSYNYLYYVSNGDGSQSPYSNDQTYQQYDGLTKPLTAKTKVTPGQTYRVTIVIADGGDGIYDSGAFIEEGGITASLGENTLSNFVHVLYNPSNQQATIQITEYQENVTYSVVDLSGKVMQQSKITETSSIDLSGYASGMYLIRVAGSNGQMTRKIIR